MNAHTPFVKYLGCLIEVLKSSADMETRERCASQRIAKDRRKTTNSAATHEEKSADGKVRGDQAYPSAKIERQTTCGGNF